MSIKSISISLFLLLFAINVQAQRGVNKALQEFENTEFMIQFSEIREVAKRTVKDFKMNQHNYDEYQIEEMKVAYNNTAQQFNQVLYEVKADFLNRKKMKYIAKFPDSYSKGLAHDLDILKEVYANDFQKTLAGITGEHQNGFLLLLPEILAFADKLVGHLIAIKKEAKHLTDVMLESRLIEPNKFPLWHEIYVPKGRP